MEAKPFHPTQKCRPLIHIMVPRVYSDYYYIPWKYPKKPTLVYREYLSVRVGTLSLPPPDYGGRHIMEITHPLVLYSLLHIETTALT